MIFILCRIFILFFYAIYDTAYIWLKKHLKDGEGLGKGRRVVREGERERQRRERNKDYEKPTATPGTSASRQLNPQTRQYNATLLYEV